MSAFGGIADIARQGDWLIGSRVSVRPENFQGAGRRLGADICRDRTQPLRGDARRQEKKPLGAVLLERFHAAQLPLMPYFCRTTCADL